MSWDGSGAEEQTEVVFVADVVTEESSEDPPMEEWSSLVLELPETNIKRARYAEGLYKIDSGDICAKYIPQSDSSVFRHVYYNYPGVLDPGIKAALLQPEIPIIYPDDGQELYLQVCKEMTQSPVREFYRGLVESEIDLRYYCVNPKGVRAMSMALKFNKTVQSLSLMDSFLNDDACYHLGEMLTTNACLTELNLSGCRIGPSGTKRLFTGLITNRMLRTLHLNRNQILDTGVEYIAEAVFRGMDVQKLSLSYNNLGPKSLNALSEAFETHNKFTALDLSWNNLFSPGAIYNFLGRLSESKVLQEINLSWNSLFGGRVGSGIKNVMLAPNLRVVNVSNNKLTGDAINNLIINLAKAKKLNTLDLSFNPITPEDALNILQKMKLAAVKLQNLVLENILVDAQFLELLQQVKRLKFRKNFTVTYGGVVPEMVIVGADPREVLLNRADFLGSKAKKNKIDIALVVLQLLKDKNYVMESKDFCNYILSTKAPLDYDLIDAMVNVFPGPRTPKSKTIDIKLFADYIQRKWPERKLPPTPPPEPESELVPETKDAGKDKKEKGKK